MFSEAKARRVTQFIECLRHTKGEFHGQPFKLLPWQERVVRDVFGTVRDEDPSMRQYNTAYIEIPKKNGKSELGAAIALNMLCNDDEWRAEVYSCASDRQQAAIVFDVAVDMVKQSPALSRRIKIIPSTKRMVFQPTGSIYQVLSSEVATKHGLNVSACIFDELHTQPTRALYDVMTQGSGDARKQPLWFLLTTAGTDRNSICWEVHQKALDIIEGRKDDPRFYPVLFGLPDDADWTDEKNWYRANPSLDKTISIDKVRDAFRKAQETPADENMFRQLRLNQWVKQSVRWMPMDKWDECGSAVNEFELEGRECYAGLDLSSTSDLTAMVLVFPPRDEDEQYIVLPFFWLPEDTLQLLVVTDGYETATSLVSVDRAFANMHLSGHSTGGVAIGKFSAATYGHPLFECEFPAVFGGGINKGAVEIVNITTINSNFKVYRTGEYPRIIRFGNLVFLEGCLSPSKSLTMTSTSNQYPMITIPDGYRPTRELIFVCHGSTLCLWLLRINTAGECIFERYRKGDAYSAPAAGNWLPFSATWLLPE